MDIKEDKVKEVMEKTISDLESALVQYGNSRFTDNYIKQAKSRITTLVDIINWDER